MKKLILLLAVSTFLFNSCRKKQDNFVSNLIRETKQKQSAHYKINQKYYYSNAQDTTVTPCEVWAVRDNNDTLRNGYVWVDNYYRPYNMIYDNGNFYLAIPPKKVTALYPNFVASLISDIDWIDIFLKPNTLQKQLSDSLNITSLSDTVYKGEECKKVFIQFPVNENRDKISYTYILSKKHFMPLYAVLKSQNKEYTLFEVLFFSDYKFDNVNRTELAERQKKVLEENPIEDRSNNSELSIKESMLQKGDNAPLFEGKKNKW